VGVSYEIVLSGNFWIGERKENKEKEISIHLFCLESPLWHWAIVYSVCSNPTLVVV